MKKFILTTLFCILSLTTVFAANDIYGSYWNGNRNYPIINGRMGTGWYLDKSSIVILKNDPDGLAFAENIITVNVKTQAFSTSTVWLYKPSTSYNMAYIKYNKEDSWNKLDLSNTAGYNLFARNAFFAGWEAITGYPYHL